MATIVREIMNRELFSVRPTDATSDVLNGILALGITGAPVLGQDGRPVGMVSLKDLVSRTGSLAADLMTAPAAVVGAGAPIADAGRLLAETGYHRLVVVDADGRAAGIVSALDVVRGLLGLPAIHPSPFPHLDRETGLTWTDDFPLDLEHLDAAPDGPGLLVLIHGGASLRERVVWAEPCENVSTRLAGMLSTPQTEQPLLSWWLARRPLRFRAAAVADASTRRRAIEGFLREAGLPFTESWI